MTGSTRRARWRPWLLGLGAVALVVWLVAEGELFGSTLSPAPDPASEDADAALLAGRAPDAAGPGLVGLGGPDAPTGDDVTSDVPRGTLTVRCLAPDGTPLGGARVEVVPGPPVGSPVSPTASADAQAAWESQALARWSVTADAHGIAVLEAVPMDGSVVARLRDMERRLGSPVWWASDVPVLFEARGAAGDTVTLRAAVAVDEDKGAAAAGRLHRALRTLAIRLDDGGRGRLVAAPEATVRGPEVTLQQAEGLPLEIRPIDVLRNRWREDLPATVAPSFAGRVPDDVPCALWTRLLPGGDADVTVHVHRVADGDTVPTRASLGRCRISPAAKALRAEVPVWPEADVWLSGLEAGEGAAPTVRVRLDGTPLDGVRLEPGSAGQGVVRGVPHRPGAEVGIEVLRGDAPAGSAEGVLPGRVGERLALHVAPETPAAPLVSLEVGEFGFDGVIGRGTLRLRAGGAPTDAPAQLFVFGAVHSGTLREGDEAEPDAAPPPAVLTVIVQAPPGRRASDAIVRCAGRTVAADVRGAAVFEGLEPGTHEILIDGAGPSVRIPDITLEAGSRAELRVDVPAPARIDVSVVDTLGREVPFAQLEVTQPSQLPWCDLDGSTQRIDPYVDARGRRTLRNLEAGTIAILARQGELVGRAEVEVEAGGRRSVRITLAPPAAEAPATGTPGTDE